jgi:hypothetical protein
MGDEKWDALRLELRNQIELVLATEFHQPFRKQADAVIDALNLVDKEALWRLAANAELSVGNEGGMWWVSDSGTYGYSGEPGGTEPSSLAEAVRAAWDAS